MNIREIGEIRRHTRRDRSSMTEIFGCYVNGQKQIVSEFRQSMGLIPENEADRYFGMFRRVLSGTIGKNLINISFQTSQVVDSPEHKALMTLCRDGLKDEAFRHGFFEKIIASAAMEDGYLILAAVDAYDVPFRGKDDELNRDGGDQVYRYVLCAICPVKQTKALLHYVPEEGKFHDGGIMQSAASPAVGFLFPAFDDRATNIYGALYYTKDTKRNQDVLVDSVFHVKLPQPAEVQRTTFHELLTDSLGSDCSMEVAQAIHNEISQRIAAHKESRDPEALTVSKEEISSILAECNVSEENLAKFHVGFDEMFGYDCELHPKNIVNPRRYEVRTPEVSIRVDPTRSDLVEMRTINGVNYVLINADAEVEVNGISIHKKK